MFCFFFQGPLIEDTSKLMNTTLQISCASVQAFLVAVAAERDFSKWKLGWNVGLAAIVYSVMLQLTVQADPKKTRRPTN